MINYSGGRPSPTQQNDDAVSYANTYDVAIVAAVGNDCHQSVNYPAAFSSTYSNVIAVSATDHHDEITEYTSVGPEVNVAAPGGFGYPNNCFLFADAYFDADDIFSTTPNYPFYLGSVPGIDQNYGFMAGTSMAAPHVAGLVGLILAVIPSYTPSQIRSAVEQTADDVNSVTYPGFDEQIGHGRINALKALSLVNETPLNPHWFSDYRKPRPEPDFTLECEFRTRYTKIQHIS